MEYDEITADWARKRIDELSSVATKKELEDILDIIANCVENRVEVAYLVNPKEEQTVFKLRDRGFKVTQNADASRDGHVEYDITWY